MILQLPNIFSLRNIFLSFNKDVVEQRIAYVKQDLRKRGRRFQLKITLFMEQRFYKSEIVCSFELNTYSRKCSASKEMLDHTKECFIRYFINNCNRYECIQVLVEQHKTFWYATADRDKE